MEIFLSMAFFFLMEERAALKVDPTNNPQQGLTEYATKNIAKRKNESPASLFAIKMAKIHEKYEEPSSCWSNIIVCVFSCCVSCRYIGVKNLVLFKNRDHNWGQESSSRIAMIIGVKNRDENLSRIAIIGGKNRYFPQDINIIRTRSIYTWWGGCGGKFKEKVSGKFKKKNHARNEE